MIPDAHAGLDEFRSYASERTRRATGTASPAAGEIWLTHFRCETSEPDGSGLPWMVLVIDCFDDLHAREQFVRAAPVSENARVAAEWSFIVPPARSDWGERIVIHLDFQFSASRSALIRKIANLAESTYSMVRAALAALDAGNPPPGPTEFGRLGWAHVRMTDEWDELASSMLCLLDDAFDSLNSHESVSDVAPASSGGADPESVAPVREPDLERREPEHPSLQPRMHDRAPLEGPTTPSQWKDGATLPDGVDDYHTASLSFWSGMQPLEADLRSELTSLGGAIRHFLAVCYAGQIDSWAAQKRVELDPTALRRVESIPLSELDGLTPIQQIRYFRRMFGNTPDAGIEALSKETLQFIEQRNVAGAHVRLRAARTTYNPTDA